MPSRRIRKSDLDRLEMGTAELDVFVSATQTGTGAAQNVAHGLGRMPRKVVVVPQGAVTGVTHGTHTITNCVVTVTNTIPFIIIAFG